MRSSPTRRSGCRGAVTAAADARPAPRDRRRRRHRPWLDDRRRGLLGVRPRRRGGGERAARRLALAAGVAYCNAVASAQLAAQYPTSGGTYVYGRERLGEWWGFLAGWGFVVGKTASCAAMALTFAAYAVPGPDWLERPVAVVAVLALTAVNLRGITRTAGLTRILVALLARGASRGRRRDSQRAARATRPTWRSSFPAGYYGVLQSAGLLFFAFAGYARIATLGEEVRDPERTIPRAIPLALGITVAIYAVVAAVRAPGARLGRARASSTPLVDAPSRRSAPTGPCRSWASGRRSPASARCSPSSRGSGARPSPWPERAICRAGWPRSHPRYRVPDHAELAVAAAVIAPRPDDRPAWGDRVLSRLGS